MSVLQVHDKFVDQVFSNQKNLTDFIKGHLPESLVRRLDLSTVRLKKGKKTSREYRRYYLDFVVITKLDGIWSELYFIIEHKSYPESDSLVQVVGYCAVKYEEDMRDHGELRPVIPVILYHGRQRWNLPFNFGDYFDVPEEYKKYMVQFEYVLVDLSEIGDEELLRKLEENARLYASLYALKNIFSELSKFKVLLLRLIDVDRETIGFIIDYVVRAREGSKEEMEKMLKEVSMPTIAEQWIQEGFHQGMQQGLLLEAQEMVLEALEERFGIVSKSIAQKIKQIDSREVVKSLFRLAMRIDSLEEFEAKLKIAMN